MNILALDLFNYDSSYFYYIDTQTNIVMNEGTFTKVLYTHPNFTMNRISFFVPFFDAHRDQMYENKYLLTFDINMNENKELLNTICKLETQLLYQYALFKNVKKKTITSIYNQVSKGKIKVHGNITPGQRNVYYILKVSGIWENETSYGVTSKWILSCE